MKCRENVSTDNATVGHDIGAENGLDVGAENGRDCYNKQSEKGHGKLCGGATKGGWDEHVANGMRRANNDKEHEICEEVQCVACGMVSVITSLVWGVRSSTEQCSCHHQRDGLESGKGVDKSDVNRCGESKRHREQ